MTFKSKPNSFLGHLTRRNFLLSGTGGVLGSGLLRLMGRKPSSSPSGLPGWRGKVEIIHNGLTAPQALFSVQELQAALEQQGFLARVAKKPSRGSARIFLRMAGDPLPPKGNWERRLKVADMTPESYAVSMTGDREMVVEGSDPTGLMYGTFELAEQIGRTRGDIAGQVRNTSKSPFLNIRGVNMFLMTQDIHNPEGAFWSEEFWTGFLGMMARNRYNFLDIQGPCDGVTVEFPNGFSYFVSLPDFRQVGVGPEQAAKNMAQFQKVLRMAQERGIHVGYMNYVASPPIGPWKTRRFGVAQRWVPVPQKFLRGPQVATYTRQAVTSFLRSLPDLWMFGFRIGESGQPPDFYKTTYLAALEEFPKTLKLYVRTWLTHPWQVRALGRATSHPLYIEIKYNGEQLGSPYQAVQGARNYPPSGSYENYTNYPRDYSIIWQIRAHGTHRVFTWAWPEFARRTMRSCKFGDGAGFSMEPMDAYCPAEDYLHNNPGVTHSFYKYMYQREWAWHLIWGRTSYDPDVPDSVWKSQFENHFGRKAGEHFFEALTESSKIVPFVFSYHNQGLDHQNYAPEFEAGDHSLNVRGRFWQGKRLVPYGGNNDDFLTINTLDRTAMADPVDLTKARLKELHEGRMTPFEAADYLLAAAEASQAKLAEARRLTPHPSDEFECFGMDIEAAGWLGAYYRYRLLSATWLEFYRQSYDHPPLTKAYEYLKKAADAWNHLSHVTERHFGYVPEYIRMGVPHYRWREEGRTLGADMEQIDQMEEAFRKMRGKEVLVIGHIPPLQAEPGKPLKIMATYPTIRSHDEYMALYYRHSKNAPYTRVRLQSKNKFERTWAGEIPAAAMTPGILEYYLMVEPGISGHYGSTLSQQPPYHVFVTDNHSKPVIRHTPPKGPVRGDFVNLEAEVEAKAPLAKVVVCHKRMPSYDAWIETTMQPAGACRYGARVPLTPVGMLYYFKAVDAVGNASHYPDFLVETPYLVINSWDARAHANSGQ